MYRKDLSTKETRLAAREASITAARKRGAIVTHHEDADCISVVQHIEVNYHTLVVYNGTAYRPSVNYYFRTTERLQAFLDKHLASRAASIARKAESRKQGKTMSGHAQTAAAIRRKLARTFPCEKFSVTSECFAGGDSVRVSWTDGPIADLVDTIVNQYEHGSFDSMDDCYHYRAIDPALDCPGVKYLHTRREMSDARRTEIEQAARISCGGQLPLNLWGSEFCPKKFEASHQELWAEAYRAEFDRQQGDREAAAMERETEEREALRREEERLAGIKEREALMYQTAKISALLLVCDGLSTNERADLEGRQRETFRQLHGEIIHDETAKLTARYVAVLNSAGSKLTLSPAERAAFLAQSPAMLQRFEYCPELIRQEPLAIVDPAPAALVAFLREASAVNHGAQPLKAVPESNIVDLAAYRASRLQ